MVVRLIFLFSSSWAATSYYRRILIVYHDITQYYLIVRIPRSNTITVHGNILKCIVSYLSPYYFTGNTISYTDHHYRNSAQVLDIIQFKRILYEQKYCTKQYNIFIVQIFSSTLFNKQ